MQFRPPKASLGWAIWALIVIIIIAIAVPVGFTVRTAWGAKNLAYDVTPDELIITFGPSRTRIERASITRILIIDSPTKARRHAGTSMVGLKEGSWSFAETGRITLYATTTRPLTVIETAERKWGISPADPAALVQALQVGQSEQFEPAAGAGPEAMMGLFIMLLAVLGGFAVLVAYLLRVARSLSYELGTDALRIYGGWRPIQVAYNRIARVEVAEPKGHPWRLYGISMPGLFWGSFTWKHAGPNLRLYATRIRPLVLVTVGHQTYGITPDDAETFVDELRQRLPGGA